MEGFSLLPKDLYFFMNGLEKYLPNVGSGSAKTRNLYLGIHNVWGQEFFDNAPKGLAEKCKLKSNYSNQILFKKKTRHVTPLFIPFQRKISIESVQRPKKIAEHLS